MKPLCAYCGTREGTTADHVPPKVCFPKPRPQLITVPACERCNGEFSKEDEEFASLLSLRVGMDGPATSKLHEKNKRIVAHNQRLLRLIREKSHKVLVQNSGAVVGSAYAFHWHGEAHDRMIRRIIRGLHFHIRGYPLPSRVPVHGSWSKSFALPEIFELWKTFPGQNVGIDGQFRFRYAFAEDNPECSVWMMIFYDRHFATGHTGIWGDEEEDNQPPQHNAGSRPSSDDLPASETPSSFGPSG